MWREGGDLRECIRKLERFTEKRFERGKKKDFCNWASEGFQRFSCMIIHSERKTLLEFLITSL